MNCAACGEENREGAKFCAECGTPFAALCGNCNSELRPAAKFCDECGRSTVDDDAVDEAVRKTVTVMFADLVGSTAFEEKVDAESARTVMARYHDMAQRVIDRHAGTLVKFIGDGVMAVFGIPEVAEDDALRAVRAGLDMQRDFAAIAIHVGSTYGAQVGLRVGLNTGEIVIADEDADLVGDVLNTAARLEGACASGDVLVGEDTWRLTRSSVSFEVLNEVSVKGKELPVASFRVLAAVEDDFQTPFVGREHELDQLTVGFDAANAAGRARLITVIGSPGVGKTRLAAELCERTSPYSQAFDLRVDRSGTSTFGPVADLLREVAGIEEGLDTETTVAGIREFVADDAADPARLVDLLAGFVGAAEPRSTEESFWATRRLLEVLGLRAPVVLVIDDLQWAEPLFLDLIEHLVEWVEAPVLMVGLARPEIRDIRPTLSEPGRRVSDVISIEGLDPAATEALAARILDTDELPDELVELLPESTQGNPLFVRELVRMLVDDNVIAEVGGRWQMAIDRGAIEVPPTIQSLLATRVERMPEDERTFLEMASVVGSEFSRGAVEALLPSLTPGELDRLLERLRRKELVDPTGNYWGDEPLLRFHHVLIRDAAYRRLLKQRRAELHLTVAEWTAQTAQRLTGDHEIQIAYHYDQAHEYRSELGPLDDEGREVGRKAAELLHTAAASALDQDDLAAAGTLTQRALSKLEKDGADRADLLLLGCEAFLSAGNANDAEPLLAELAIAAQGSDRLRAWADAFEGQLAVLRSPDQLLAAEGSVASAATTLESLDDQAGVAKARLVRALILASLGRVGEAEGELDEALTAARAADDRRRITTVLGAAPLAALWGPSPVARAGGRCLDIIRLLRITSASPLVEATSVRCQGVLEAMRGRYDQARELIGRSRETAEELGQQQGVLETEEFAGLVELFAGDPALAEMHLQVAHDGFAEMGASASAGRAAALLARSLLQQGRIEEAAAYASEADALSGQALQTAIGSRAVLAEIAANQDRHSDALALAEEAESIGAGTDLTVDHAVAARSLATVHRVAGNEHRAVSADESADVLFESKGAVVAARASPEKPSKDSTPIESDPGLPLLHNAATEWVERWVLGGYTISDMGDYLASLAPDAVWIDESESGEVLRDTPQQFADYLTSVINDDPTFRPVGEPVALRGSRLCLYHLETERSSTFIRGPRLYLYEINQQGLLAYVKYFHTDRLVDAMAELDARFAQGEGAEFAETLALLLEFSARTLARDRGGMLEMLDPDFETVRHHAVKALRANAEQFVDLQLDRRELGGSESHVLVDFHRLTHDGFVMERRPTQSGRDIFADATIDVVLARNGKVARAESFEADQLETALACFDELTGSSAVPALENEATRLFRAVNLALLDERDLQAASALSRDDGGFVFDDRRHLGTTMTVDDFGEYIQPMLESDQIVPWNVEVIAIRGDRLALLHFTSDFVATVGGSDYVSVCEVADGRILESVAFDPEDLPNALEELERRYDEGDGAEFAHVSLILRETVRQFVAGDATAWRKAVTDSYVLHDHRAGTRGTYGAADFEAMILAGSDVVGSEIFVPITLHAINHHGRVATMRQEARTDDGFEAEWAWIAVGMVDGDRVDRAEFYDIGDLDLALARFDELTASRTTSGLENSVTRLFREFNVALHDDRDLAKALSLSSPVDVAFDDRRALPTVMSTAAFAEWIRPTIEAENHISWSLDFVAVRGDLLALYHFRSEYVGTAGGSDYLGVVELVDGGLTVVAFNLEDFGDALEELERRYHEGEGAAYAHIRKVTLASAALVQSGDGEAWRAAIADSFEAHDHRSGTFGAYSVSEIQAVISAGPEVHGPQQLFPKIVHRTNGQGTIETATRLSTSGFGFEAEWEWVSINLVEGGKVSRYEFYNIEDLDLALARFDELTAEPGDDLGAANAELDRQYAESLVPPKELTLAQQAADRLQRAVLDDDSDRAVNCFSLDFVGHSSRRIGSGGGVSRETVVESALVSYSLHGGAWNVRSVATRGSSVSLIELGWGTGEAFQDLSLWLSEVNDQGLFVRVHTFDEDRLEDAIAMADQWFKESLPSELAVALDSITLGIAVGRGADLAEELAATLSDDLVAVDHRNLSFPDLDKRGSIDRTLSMRDVSPGDLQLVECAFLVTSDRGGVVHLLAASSGEASFEYERLGVILVADGQVTSFEYFEPDDLAGALARFEELTSS